RARFHALVGDWIYATMDAGQIKRDQEHAEQVNTYYADATELGLIMSAPRLERWANVLLDLGRLDGARERLEELDALDLASSGEARPYRNRVLRRLIERTLKDDDLSFDDNLALLDDYLNDPRLRLKDRIWAIARKAELRLEDGQPAVARDHLIVDMRRLDREYADHEELHPGELYTLLGRAYFDLGDSENAAFHLDRALSVLRDTDAVRGDALVLLGNLAVEQDDLELAVDRYSTVVDTFHATRSYLPGLLGRAEVRSMLGHHDLSMADYALVTERLLRGEPRRDITPARVAQSLLDRHNAVLPTGRLDIALAYAKQAETIFRSDDVPVDVLAIIARTSEALARRTLGDTWTEDGPTPAMADLPVAVRNEARLAFEQAAKYYKRHAQAVVLAAGSDEVWAYSLRKSAETYDLAGRPDLAIELLDEYLERRSTEDGARNEVMYRLARALQAELRFADAATWYQKLIDTSEAGRFATESFVPLARCYLALDRPRDAETLLQRVLDGKLGALLPDAEDYQDAMIELGRIRYESGDYVGAMELLSEARKRYPDDPRMLTVMFNLADSQRRYANQLQDTIDNDATLTPADRAMLRQRRLDALVESEALFTDVVAAYRAMPPERRNRSAEATLRFASLYRADTAFARGAYQEAVELYDGVAREFRDHPSSIHALIQIVNCYAALGDDAQKLAAHERATYRLAQMPDDVFDEPDALLDRKAWENWLRNLPIGMQSASANTDSISP
ncbi:MAG: tetratricopeptide repeat protein, partial [Phycisphaerales bacterium]|nr:tetratricopeptide repeat protein [Phycisphaerales bacterium]